MIKFDELFTPETLDALFPPQRADEFFTALFGDPDDGAYDIRLAFVGNSQERLNFEFALSQRPRKCLSCSLTYGLPEVFQRHPLINIKGLTDGLSQLIRPEYQCTGYELGRTQTRSNRLHVIPLTLFIEPNAAI